MKGANPRTIEAICGWKDPRTVARYQHVNSATLHETVARLEEPAQGTMRGPLWWAP